MVMTSEMNRILFKGITAEECDVINSKGKIISRGRRRHNNAPIIRFAKIRQGGLSA